MHAKVASSFISPEQAELNLKEIGNKTFEQTKEAGRKAWNNVLGRIKVEDSDENRMRTFYSCLYRSVLFPRMFYEVNGKGETVHYSPIMVKSVRDICLPTLDSGILSVACFHLLI